MSIRNKGTIIRLARKNANLTQEQLSEGICSPQLLSQIESGNITVSASYFDSFMSRAGTSVSAYPYYKNRTDFDCFYTLKRARLYLNAWQLENAYNELDFVENHNWAENKFHYSEWILLHGKLQLLSGCCDHQKNYDFLLKGLHLTHPNLDFFNFNKHLLSVIELEYLLLLAEENLYLNNLEDGFAICSQIEHYLSQTYITYLVKERLLADNAYVLGNYYLLNRKYEKAISIIEPYRHSMAVNGEDFSLFRLTFLKGLASYFLYKNKDALNILKTVLYSTHAIDSCYTTICFEHLKSSTDIDMDVLFPLELFPLISHAPKYECTFVENTSETIEKHKYISLGQIMKSLREDQNLSLDIVCQGLCSKSTLSKIEHNYLQPDIFLTEALLQRLGISERPFDFYGNKQEHEFYTLKFQSIHMQLLEKNFVEDTIKELNYTISPKNNLQKQFLHLSKASLCTTVDEKIKTYFEALYYTLPNFNISRIHEYRLTWAEASILNNITHLYIKTNMPTLSFYYFNQLENYYKSTKIDILLLQNIYTPLLEMYCHCLYNQHHFVDALHFFHREKIDYLKSNTNRFSFFLFYFSQLTGELEQYEDAYIFGNYSYALCKLNELDANAKYLKKYLMEDFNIELVEF